MGHFRCTIKMVIPLKRESDALDILSSVIQQMQFEAGCISCMLYRSVEETPRIMLEQIWKSEEDALEHLRSDIYRRILLVIEMAQEPPEVRFDVIAQSSGFETIEKARTQIRKKS